MRKKKQTLWPLYTGVRMRSDRYYVQYIRGSLSWVASGIVSFPRRE